VIKQEDRDLFFSAMGEVTPIISDKQILNSVEKPKPYPKKKDEVVINKFTRTHEGSSYTLEAEDTLSYLSNGLQKNVLKKMRKGFYGLDAELDLHGLTSTQAKHELSRFLHFCEQDGCRCVRIIHGKGYRSVDNISVLKNELNIWLRRHHEVQAFCSAAQRDGGAGAVLVLLYLSSKYQEQDDT